MFVVLERNIDSDVNKPEAWGKNAVILDSWLGDAYPAYEAYTRLKTHRWISVDNDATFQVILSFNPKYHQLTSAFFVENPVSFQMPYSKVANNEEVDDENSPLMSFFNYFA
ncbi:hypothetical protein FOG18_01660 [Legionella israelensis]|uniref:hypothetical protein n=1 Tax=Legionella israelensis TaxID=454 RepID=UPI00117C1C40|nr:hypothetical protein [Legionella israelensis]QDP71375.1 hypothetical protein FOG18_01660 [Legionella israelensis]